MLLNWCGLVNTTRDHQDYGAGQRPALAHTRGLTAPQSCGQKLPVRLTLMLNRSQPCWWYTGPGHRNAGISPARAQGPADWTATLLPRPWCAFPSRGAWVHSRVPGASSLEFIGPYEVCLFSGQLPVAGSVGAQLVHEHILIPTAVVDFRSTVRKCPPKGSLSA